jgi:hypothetical protein
MLGIDHHDQAAEGMSLEQIQAFLEASDELEFKAINKEEIYGWASQALQQLHYRKLKRSGRGLVRRVLEAMLAQFPFRILGFHSDNGSEFINHTVAGLLEKAVDRADQVTAATQQRQRAGGKQERSGGEKAHGVQPYHGAARGGDRSFLRAILQSLPEFPSNVWRTRGGGQRQRQGETSVPTIQDLEQRARAQTDTTAAAEMQQAKQKHVTTCRRPTCAASAWTT